MAFPGEFVEKVEMGAKKIDEGGGGGFLLFPVPSPSPYDLPVLVLSPHLLRNSIGNAYYEGYLKFTSCFSW